MEKERFGKLCECRPDTVHLECTLLEGQACIVHHVRLTYEECTPNFFMKPEMLGDLADKLEALLARLPGPLQKPVLKELNPLKELFLRQRPVRFAVAGAPGIPVDILLARLFGGPIHHRVDEKSAVNPALGRYERPGGGAVEVLDLRRPAALGSRIGKDEPVDLCLFFHEGTVSQDGHVPDIEIVENWVSRLRAADEVPPRLVALLMDEHLQGRDLEKERIDFHGALLAKSMIEPLVSATFHTSQSGNSGSAAGLGGGSSLTPKASSDAILYLYHLLPNEARLEMARFSGAKEAQRSLAAGVIKSATAVCAAVGAQPIPLADLPLLTSAQAAMVAGIVHLSGKPFSLKLAAEFIAAVGANVGVGIFLRETSRALLKFFPGWGNIISGALAAAGTYAVGRAASAYFIDGVPLPKARSIFQNLRKKGRKETAALLKDGKLESEDSKE